MQVHIETLTHTGTETYPSRRKGAAPVEIKRHTIEVTINGDRRAVDCYPMHRDGTLDNVTIYGLAVRFSQGDKVWPGSATYWAKSGNVNNLRPNIDKRGAFFLVGYAADFADTRAASQHNAVR